MSRSWLASARHPRFGRALPGDGVPASGTGQILAAAAEGKWTVIDMAADWTTIHPDT